jgi:hypothetical protein
MSGQRVHQDLGNKLVDVTLGMRIRIPVYRVTKYNPAFRDQSGAYTKVEWTSFTQIGQTFSGELLTSDEYERVEEAYVQAALSFLRESGLFSMRVAGLENPRKQPLDLQNDGVLPLERIGEIIRRILREEFWCRLEGSEGFIHFGWDYYMYICVPHPCPTARARAAELGLYVEEFASPVLESVREAEAEAES